MSLTRATVINPPKIWDHRLTHLLFIGSPLGAMHNYSRLGYTDEQEQHKQAIKKQDHTHCEVCILVGGGTNQKEMSATRGEK